MHSTIKFVVHHWKLTTILIIIASIPFSVFITHNILIDFVDSYTRQAYSTLLTSISDLEYAFIFRVAILPFTLFIILTIWNMLLLVLLNVPFYFKFLIFSIGTLINYILALLAFIGLRDLLFNEKSNGNPLVIGYILGMCFISFVMFDILCIINKSSASNRI